MMTSQFISPVSLQLPHSPSFTGYRGRTNVFFLPKCCLSSVKSEERDHRKNPDSDLNGAKLSFRRVGLCP